MKHPIRLLTAFLITTLLLTENSLAQNSKAANDTAKKNLIPPMLLKRNERLAGNPLATYAEMISLEKSYRESPLAPIYDEMRFNMEEFLGIPDAGKRAMHLPQFRVNWESQPDSIDPSFINLPALPEIINEAKKTHFVIWGEEHHLPQTRSLYEPLLKELWKAGYRYLAAESFADNLADSVNKYIDYKSGYYLADPVFASAVNTAIQIGYKLIDYDTYETSPTEPSFRDIRQAENIFEKTLKIDKAAKVLILAGRGHASEDTASNGWKPMAYNLKKLSGIDPFTLYSVTMTERFAPEEEHPFYRYATKNGLVKQVTVFKNKNSGKFLSSGAFDAYVFFPRVQLEGGRPDWLFTTTNRKKVKNPFKENKTGDLQLVQVFMKDQPANTIPIDQFIIQQNKPVKYLALNAGDYWARIINESGKVIKQTTVKVK